jgi:hypothetical protein
MARKRRTNKPKAIPKRPRKSDAVREPWTPWGKWAKARRERVERRKREREQRRADRRRARQLRRLRRRRLTARGAVFLGLIVLACVVGGLVLFLLGRPYPWEAIGDTARVLELSNTLDERRERWQRLAVRHYTIEVSYTTDEARCGPVIVEVRDGEIVEPPTPAEGHWFPAKTCDKMLDTLTIDDAFVWLDHELENVRPGSTNLSVDFDPDFGYPTHARADTYEDDRLPGCCWEATWHDLRPLD